MRELLLKNFVSKDKKRTELFLSERFEQGGIVQEIEKKTAYRIKEILEFTDVLDLDLYLEQKKEQAPSVQRFIIRNRSARGGIDKSIYKIVANQYIVVKDKIIAISTSQYVKKTIFNGSARLSAARAFISIRRKLGRRRRRSD